MGEIKHYKRPIRIIIVLHSVKFKIDRWKCLRITVQKHNFKMAAMLLFKMANIFERQTY